AHRGHEVGLAVAADPLDRVRTEQHQGNEPEHGSVALEEDLVEGRLDEPRDEALRTGDHDGEGAADDEPVQVRPEIRPQPPQEAIRGLASHQTERLAASRRWERASGRASLGVMGDSASTRLAPATGLAWAQCR